MTAPAALLLADGRFPAGGHAHSAGIESAVADGRVTGEASLAAYLRGRLRTTGLVDAALAAATALALDGARPADAERAGPAAADPAPAGHAGHTGRLAALDAEADARLAAPPLRHASRKLGRQLVRVALRCWPGPTIAGAAEVFPGGLHQAVALGLVGRSAGCDAGEVARLAVHHALTTPAQAAVRLLGLDPFGVAAVTARLAGLADDVAAEALALARTCAPADLPALTSPLVEVAAVEHRARDMRLFAT